MPVLLICALLISVVFACVFHSRAKARFFAALRYFFFVVIVSLAVAWLMYPFSH